MRKSNSNNQDEEANQNEKTQGLEIISIGSLYTGPWEKKYWTSSRGKDRHPYPVGYRARRACNGSAYNMEIHQGPKGPLFLISSAKGESCSAHTPDIAWDNFQKKCCPRIKRSFPRMKGLEFFGFKNTSVQRLLRELVANLNGIPERSSVSPSSCDRTTVEHSNRCPDACSNQDLLHYLPGQQVKGAIRSKRISPNLSTVSALKRLRSGNLTCITEASNSTTGNHSPRTSMSSHGFKEEHDCSRIQVEFPDNLHIQPLCRTEDSHFSTSKDVGCLEHLTDNDCPADGAQKLSISTDLNSTPVVGNLSDNEKALVRSRATEVDSSSSVLVEAVARSSPAAENFESTCDGDLCAPDTLDFAQDDIRYYAPDTNDQSTCGMKEELVLTENVTSEGLVPESHHEDEIGTSSSNLSSEKSEFGSVSHEIAKSMITVLLPQAIPLLIKNSGKEKKPISPKNFSMPTPHQGENETGYLVKAGFTGINHSVVPSYELTKRVILDCLDDYQTEGHAMNQLTLSSNRDESGHSKSDKDAYPHSTEQFVCINMKEPTISHVEGSDCKDIFCHDEMQFASSSKHQKTDPYLHGSVLVYKASNSKIFPEEGRDATSNVDKNFIGAKCHPEDKGCTSTSDYNKGKDNIANGSPTAPANTSLIQVPKKVYTRKKVSNGASTKRKCKASLSEGVRFRNSVDGSDTETTGVTGRLQGLSTDRASDKIINRDPMLEKLSPFASHNPTSLCAADGKDAAKFSVASAMMVDHADKTPVGEEIMLDVNGLTSSHMQGSQFNHKIIPTMEIKDNSDIKLKSNLEVNNELDGRLEFLGCYFHPKPASLLLLRAKGDEIYVGAVCGPVVDKERMLYLYKLVTEGTRTAQPSFIGHTSITFPSSSDIYGREIALERSGIQLTPNGKCLILLGSIKTPLCREARIDCLCSTCTSDSIDHHSVKILHVEAGYVSVLVKLSTAERIQCILICEPSNLVAAGEGGSLHIWTMNSEWSATTEEFLISDNDYKSPSIIELQRIPDCASLVVGHNGLGEFTIWNISKHIFLTRFSAPSNLVNQFLPISLFKWQNKGHGLNHSNVKEHINRNMDATNLWFSENGENHSLPSLEGEDIAMWLFVSTMDDSHVQHGYMSANCQLASVVVWRLALMVENMLIFGSTLDPRTAAIGSSGGHGIIGTLDGFLYTWELSTGNKISVLHQFKGGRVSRIATDDSRPGVLAVADDSGQLLVYRLHSGCK